MRNRNASDILKMAVSGMAGSLRRGLRSVAVTAALPALTAACALLPGNPVEPPLRMAQITAEPLAAPSAAPGQRQSKVTAAASRRRLARFVMPLFPVF